MHVLRATRTSAARRKCCHLLACTSECHEGTPVVLPIGRKAQRQEVLRGTVARPAHTRTVDAATEVQRPHGGGLTPGGECAMERSAYEDCTGITQPRDGKIPCAPRFAGAASSNHHEHVDVYVLFHCMQIVQCCSSFRCNSSNMMQHHPLRRLRTFATPSSQGGHASLLSCVNELSESSVSSLL